MKPLTQKQQTFVVNKAAGVKNKEAVIAAGYSPNGAAVQASNLMSRPSIIAAIKAAKNGGYVDITANTHTMPRDNYADPLTFLQDVMNHPGLPIAMRADAAKQLLPYQHARICEQGKKEAAKERARDVASSSTFRPKQPPKLIG